MTPRHILTIIALVAASLTFFTLGRADVTESEGFRRGVECLQASESKELP